MDEALPTKDQSDVTRHAELIATQYRLRSQFDAGAIIDAVSFDRMISPFYEGERWAVRRRGSVLAKDLLWEYEVMPSSRDDEFYNRCRFDSLDDAVNAYTVASNLKTVESTTV